MRENSRVPSARRSSEPGGKSTDMALGKPPVPGESAPGGAGPGGDVSSAQRDEASPAAELPRRVRGNNGVRPPARVERPVIPESVLERLRAAAESEAREATEEQPKADVAAQAGPSSEVRHGSPPDGGAEVESADDSAESGSPDTSLAGPDKAPSPSPPRRRFGKSSTARKPPSHVRPPFSSDNLKGRAEAVGETTEPIPVIRSLDTGSTNTVGSSSDSAAQKTADTGNSPSTQSGGRVLERPGPTDPRPAGRPATPAQRSARRQDAGPAKVRTGHGYRLVGLLVVVALLGIGLGSFVALQDHGHSPHRTLVPSADLPAATRNGAATWVASQVAASDTIACDPVMCSLLHTDGISKARLRILWPGLHNLSGAAVIVATPALEDQFAGRLSTMYAPGVIARFGSGQREIAIRVVAPHGPSVYQSDLRNDLSVRRQAGAELAGEAQLSAREKNELTAGQVDLRLIVVIADLERKHPVVIALGDGGPGVNTAASPLRSADLLVTSRASEQWMVSQLQAIGGQDPRYRLAHINQVRWPDGRTMLRIEFAAPSLFGLLATG